MESIQYKRRFSQKIQHAGFIQKLDSVDLKQMDSEQQKTLLELLDFLAIWLMRHIKGMDCRIGK